MDRQHRFMLLLLPLAMLLSLFYESHGSVPSEGTVAFIHSSSPGIVVRLSGDTVRAGIYKFYDGTTVGSAIYMTVPDFPCKHLAGGMFSKKLQSGDVLEIVAKDRQSPRIALSKMKVPERITLGIPLEPDSMDIEDWQRLPGIGPHLAEAIIRDRQNNGDFSTLDAVARVPGIGKGKLKRITGEF